jgi:hypothetical protein
MHVKYRPYSGYHIISRADREVERVVHNMFGGLQPWTAEQRRRDLKFYSLKASLLLYVHIYHNYDELLNESAGLARRAVRFKSYGRRRSL